jgi:cytochrome c-type biogenesis protein
MVVDVSTFVYGALAVALAIGALWTVLRATPQACAHDHTGPPASYGAIFVLGASTSLVFSPCCTPLMVSVASVALALSRPMQGAAILAAFGLGHALPLLALGGVAGRLGHWFSVRRLQQFATVGSASVMLFLAVYFGLLV